MRLLLSLIFRQTMRQELTTRTRWRSKTTFRMAILRGAICLLLCTVAGDRLAASQHVGQVSFAGVSVPGATVVAVRGDQRVTTTTDATGAVPPEREGRADSL